MKPGSSTGRWLPAALLAATVALGGCATVATPAGGTAAAEAAPIDPWERWNRRVFRFNDRVDRTVIKPAAETYRDIVPQLVRKGVDNVLGNIRDVWSAANHLLQGKGQVGLEMGMRVATNSFIGLAGLLDPATEMGLTRRTEDFGQTLGVWGLPSGPYLVLPFFGPSTVRDAGGNFIDGQFAPATLPETSAGRFAVSGLELLNLRTNLLSAGELADSVALDRYSFFRDFFLARRRDAIHDGAAPLEAFEDVPDSPPPASGPARPAGTAAAAPASAPASAPAASAPR